MYYILKPNERIEAGDQWSDAGSLTWEYCRNSINWLVKDYVAHLNNDPTWKVRRLIKQTKLGNIL